MEQGSRGSAALVVIIILGGVVLAFANVGAFLLTMEQSPGHPEVLTLAQRYQLCPACFIYLTVAPVVFGILVAVLVARLPKVPDSSAVEARPGPVAAPSPAPALRLLALLQQEGRFIDFLEENIDAYSDEQVGAAVRSIHAGCRKAIHDRIQLQRIMPDDDGSSVVVASGFDPAAIRLSGNVAGAPPFRGTLQHGGWRATNVSLPDSSGAVDSTIIAPAEVEIGA